MGKCFRKAPSRRDIIYKNRISFFRMTQSEIQIGKNGITENFIESLKINFKTHSQVRISVLKSAGHEKERVREMSEKILNDLGRNYTSKIIGFTIVVKKWRKPMR